MDSRDISWTRGRDGARRPVAWLTLALGALCGAAQADQDAVADPVPTLAPVVVTGTRTEKTLDETPIRTEVVEGAEIQRMHARTLKQALENVPGLQLTEVHGKSGYEVSL